MKSKRAIAIIVSVALIALLLWRVDLRALAANLRATNWILFAAALALFVPQILVIALRWKRLIAPFTPLSLGESVRLVLAGASMNLLLPGKLGDLTKGWFLARAGHVSAPLGLGVVVFEKMLDVATLAVFMLAGVGMLLARMMSDPAALSGAESMLSIASLAAAAGLGLAAVCGVLCLYFVPLEKLPCFSRLLDEPSYTTYQSHSGAPRSPFLAKLRRLLRGAHSTMATLRMRGARRGEVIALSFAIWVLHLAQIYLFFASVHALPGPAEFFCIVPLAIFIGLIPISIAGFGTRDAAFVTLLHGVPASAVLAASFYVNLRYILPAMAGLPFLARYAFLRRDTEKLAQDQNI